MLLAVVGGGVLGVLGDLLDWNPVVTIMLAAGWGLFCAIGEMR